MTEKHPKTRKEKEIEVKSFKYEAEEGTLVCAVCGKPALKYLIDMHFYCDKCLHNKKNAKCPPMRMLKIGLIKSAEPVTHDGQLGWREIVFECPKCQRRHADLFNDESLTDYEEFPRLCPDCLTWFKAIKSK